MKLDKYSQEFLLLLFDHSHRLGKKKERKKSHARKDRVSFVRGEVGSIQGLN